jgi:hypothetical protein
MATIKRNRPLSPSAPQDPPAEPVFSSENDRRERVLRAVGRLVAVVVGIWLLALLAGAVGFGRLPGLPGAGLVDRATGRAPAQTPPGAEPATDRNQNFANTNVSGSSGAQGQPGYRPAEGRTPAHGTPARPARRIPAGQVPPLPLAPPSPGNPQGRAVRRHGIQQPPAPPPAANGNAYGQGVINPGRTKQALPPPPPPPPPSRKP